MNTKQPEALAKPVTAQPKFMVHAGDAKVTLHFSGEAEALDFYFAFNHALSATPAADAQAVPKWIDDPHDIEQGALPNAGDAWLENARAALAAPAQAAPSASVEQEAMQMLWNDQQQEEKEHYRNVARGTELPLYAIHHPEDIDKTKRRAAPEQPVAPAKAVLADLVVQRDAAIGMLADWVVAVNTNGTGWDDWDEHFKDASFRPGPLRELLDEAIAARAVQEGKSND